MQWRLKQNSKKKKKKKNHPDIGYVIQDTCGIREAKTKPQEINAGNSESEPHTRTLNAMVNRADIYFIMWLHRYSSRTSKVANTIMVTKPKYKNNLPDRKCSNKEKLSPPSADSWDYKIGRRNRWKKKHSVDLLRIRKCFPATSPGCVIVSWSHGRQDKSNYKLCRDTSNFNCVSEVSFEYFKQGSLKKI